MHPAVFRASRDVTVMLLALSKWAWFKPEALPSAFLPSVMQCGHDKFICEIRTQVSTHPSASLDMIAHELCAFEEPHNSSGFSPLSGQTLRGQQKTCFLDQASASRPLLVQTGKESPIDYIASLWPFLCEMRERRLKKFQAYTLLYTLYSLQFIIYFMFFACILYYILY